MPPPDPRYRPSPTEATWGGILAGFALLAALPVVLRVLDQPLVGALTVAVIVVLASGVHRTARVVRCVAVWRRCTVELLGVVQVTIARTDADSCCEGGAG
jgi:hypothetical protein